MQFVRLQISIVDQNLGRTHTVEALAAVRRRLVDELILAGTIVGERAEHCPVGQW
jgi:hypothetical protein